jgi:TorA maturation chaperone TorD
LAPARQAAYDFLSAAFAQPPSAERIAALRRQKFLDSVAEVFGGTSLALLRRYACDSEPIRELERAARQEFMRLFKVPGGQYVTPYESVYRDIRDVEGQSVKGLLMGQSALAVQKWYRLAALDISPEYRDLPDHIAMELGYLARLCAKEQEFNAADDQGKVTRTWEMERDFLAAHVVSWVRNLAANIRRKTQHPYFHALAEMLVEFSQRDLVTLETVLGPSLGKSTPHYETPTT